MGAVKSKLSEFKWEFKCLNEGKIAATLAGDPCLLELSLRHRKGYTEIRLTDVMDFGPEGNAGCCTYAPSSFGLSLDRDEVLIKDGAEMTGIAEVLRKAGVVEPSGEVVGYEVYRCRLTPEWASRIRDV